MNRATGIGVLLVLLTAACEGRSSPPETSPANIKVEAAAFYDAYISALTTPRRAEIPAFYHEDGARIVLNGVSRWFTRADLHAKYEGAWSPPAFFAWDTLAFDSVGPREVVVTGAFRWTSAGQPDTVPFLYAALLVTADSGLTIRFEHETRSPTPGAR